MADLLLIPGPNLIPSGSRNTVGFIPINPGAFDSRNARNAIRRAPLAVADPRTGIRPSNIVARDERGHDRYFSDIAAGCLTGPGACEYELALRAAMRPLDQDEED